MAWEWAGRWVLVPGGRGASVAPEARMGSAVLEVLAARMAWPGAITHLAVPQVQVVAVAGPGAREAVDGVVRAALVVPVVLAADAVAAVVVGLPGVVDGAALVVVVVARAVDGQSRPTVGGSLATASDEAEAHNGA